MNYILKVIGTLLKKIKVDVNRRSDLSFSSTGSFDMVSESVLPRLTYGTHKIQIEIAAGIFGTIGRLIQKVCGNIKDQSQIAKTKHSLKCLTCERMIMSFFYPI